MGNQIQRYCFQCLCKQKVIPEEEILKQKQKVGEKIFHAIEYNQTNEVDRLVCKYMGKKKLFTDINATLDMVQNIPYNTLCYSIRLGNIETTELLIDYFNADLSIANQRFKKGGVNIIDICCEAGNVQLLQLILPRYLEMQTQNRILMTSASEYDNWNYQEDEYVQSQIFTRNNSDFQQQKKEKNGISNAFIRATERGNLGILQYLYEYFCNKQVSYQFDVHALDQKSGENCALIASKMGYLEILKWLIQYCKVNPHIVNYRNENAVFLAALGSKKRDDYPYFDIIKYLIEECQVNYVQQHEEILLVCEDREIIHYLEKQLEKDGISTKKERLDQEYSITQKNRHIKRTPMELQMCKKLQNLGNKWEFCKVFHEELFNNTPQLQSIKSVSSISNKSVSDLSFVNFSKSKIDKSEQASHYRCHSDRSFAKLQVQLEEALDENSATKNKNKVQDGKDRS